MIDPDELPIPDWGLRCPKCDTPLAGMKEHRCEACGEPFNILRVLDAHRPVPDLGLQCNECGYLLQGLPSGRCPECGAEFSVQEMLVDQLRMGSGAAIASQLADPDDHHVKRREPTYTGDERPMPEFGLACSECAQPLAGADRDTCPACGQPFDLEAMVPPGDWLDITRFIPRGILILAKPILYAAGVPYLVDNAGLMGVYGGRIPLISGKIRIPREFFFDALHAMAEADEPDDSEAPGAWTCPACDEDVPSGFEICWNCGTPYRP
jgi:rRNA maturation endonuclease Nob1